MYLSGGEIIRWGGRNGKDPITFEACPYILHIILATLKDSVHYFLF